MTEHQHDLQAMARYTAAILSNFDFRKYTLSESADIHTFRGLLPRTPFERAAYAHPTIYFRARIPMSHFLVPLQA
jgi:hypothetical protein